MELDAEQGAAAVWRTVCAWLKRSRREELEPDLLQRPGVQRLGSGATLEVLYTDSASPYLHAVRYAHPDAQVQGRRWVTELGLRAHDGAPAMSISILLATEDVATGPLPPIMPTRPALVWQLLTRNAPAPSTPGLGVRALTRDTAADFQAEVRDTRRTYPIVLVSALPSGAYLVNAEELRKLVTGLAEVVVISASEDTRLLREVVGDDVVPWMGNIRLIYPIPSGPYATAAPTRRVTPEDIDDWRIAGSPAERELFAILAHRTVRANLGRHLTPEQVREEQIRRAVARNRRGDTAQLKELRDDVVTLEEILTERDAEIGGLKRELDDWELRAEILEDEARKREHDLHAVQTQLARATQGRSETGAPVDQEGRSAVLAAIGGGPTVRQALRTVRTLYPDRLVILDSAWKSADRSEEFRHRDKALELLLKLAGPYWDALVGGGGDAQGRLVFGSHYASEETEHVENNTQGRQRRTFSYRGTPTVMLKHLKIGRKDSVTETLRVHFIWDPDERVIVVGHCGQHLDFA